MADTPRDLLNDLAAGEDEFDVDLMAAGCRIAVRPIVSEAGPAELVKLYEFDEGELAKLLDVLVADGDVDTQTLFRAAERVAAMRVAS